MRLHHLKQDQIQPRCTSHQLKYRYAFSSGNSIWFTYSQETGFGVVLKNEEPVACPEYNLESEFQRVEIFNLDTRPDTIEKFGGVHAQ
jgi:hypothetical protein